MILSAQSIRAAQIFEPFCHRTKCEQSGMTYGLGPASYDVRIAENVTLAPGEFSLASTIEAMEFPAYLAGVVHDKSTWARLGLSVFNTLIDPGFEGASLTLELCNRGNRTLEIKAGWPIAQIVVHGLDVTTEHPYAGRYQRQKRGAQEAIWEGGK